MGSEISIKGMVCQRCIAVIQAGITALGYPPDQITLGKISFINAPDNHALEKIERFLTGNGFALVCNRQVRMVRQVKEVVDEIFSKDV